MKDKEFFMLLESYESALENGNVASLGLSQDNFLDIIDYYEDVFDGKNLTKACEIAFGQYSYSAEINERYIDALLKEGRNSDALSVLNESPCQEKTLISLLYARVYLYNGNFEKADECFSVLTDFNGITEYADTVAMLASDCINVKNYRLALKYYNFLLEHNAAGSEVYSDIAFCHDTFGDFASAEKYYRKYLEAYPFDDTVWFDLGTLYAKNNLYEQAIDAFEYSIALESTNTMALHNLAIVYLNLFRYNESLKYFEEFALLEPDNPLAFAGMAESQIGLKNFSAAHYNFTKALEINPQCNEANFGMLCLFTIESYLKGDTAMFISRIGKIIKTDPSWLYILCDIFPELKDNDEFIKLLISAGKINK